MLAGGLRLSGLRLKAAVALLHTSRLVNSRERGGEGGRQRLGAVGARVGVQFDGLERVGKV
jgi:hypothetical protein